MTLSHTAAWLVLLAAGLLEVVWSVSMKASEGFTKPLLTGITIAAAWFSRRGHPGTQGHEQPLNGGGR
jgi:hypothetical protein